MKRNHSSLTAGGIAFARVMKSRKPEGERVCCDPYARAFVRGWLWWLAQATVGYAARRSPGVNAGRHVASAYALVHATVNRKIENGDGFMPLPGRETL